MRDVRLHVLRFRALTREELVRMARRGGYRRNFRQRFGCYGDVTRARMAQSPIWIHAVSAGDAGNAFQMLYPQARFSVDRRIRKR